MYTGMGSMPGVTSTMENLFYDDAWGDMNNLSLQEMDDYRQLHQLAAAIYQKQQLIDGYLNNISNANAVMDWPAMIGAANAMVQLKQQFNTLRARIDRNTRAQNQIGMLDRVILSLGTYVDQVITALPSSLASVPNAFIRAMGEVGQQGGKTLAGIAATWIIPIGLGLMLLQQLEKSPTARAAMRRR